jgi:predicted nucleotidyltransferase
MTAETILALLARHAPEFRAAGVTRMAIFGSHARGDARPGSDLDIALRFSDEAKAEGFAYFGRIEALRDRLQALVQQPVDITIEPVRSPELQGAMQADERIAFE